VKPIHPPSVATKLLEAFVSPRTSQPLVGDLIEHYERGRSRAWYWRQVLLAVAISAYREMRTRKLETIGAIMIGYLTALPISYFATSMAAVLVHGYAAYFVFLPLTFGSAAVGGWIVRRAFPPPMVVIVAASCVIASVIAFVVCARLGVLHRMPTPVLAYFVAIDFVIGPLGVLIGGLWGSSWVDDAVVPAS